MNELTIGAPTEEMGAILSVDGESAERGVSLRVGEADGEGGEARKDIDADTGEDGYQTELLGDEELEEDVREPRDNYRHYGDHTFMNDVTIAGRLIVKSYVLDRDRGQWIRGEKYYAGTLNPALGVNEQSHAWNDGCRYGCRATGTEEEPRWDSRDWAFEGGNPNLELEWTDKESTVRKSDPRLEMRARATLYNQDVTDSGLIRWDWSRQSWHNGERDEASDTLWSKNHEDLTNTLQLTMEDMNFRFGNFPEKLVYVLTATMLDEKGEPKKIGNKTIRDSIGYDV